MKERKIPLGPPLGKGEELKEWGNFMLDSRLLGNDEEEKMNINKRRWKGKLITN